MLKGDDAYRPEWSADDGGDFMTFDEKYEDVLQNLEFPIIQVYREQSDLIDAEVLMAIESLIRVYGAQAQGKSISSRSTRGLSQQVASSVQQMCEWRLGRVTLPDADGTPVTELPTPKTPREQREKVRINKKHSRFPAIYFVLCLQFSVQTAI